MCWILGFGGSLELGFWSFFDMKLGAVIGRVTLSKAVPELEGARWLVVSPFTREHFQSGRETPLGLSKDPSVVVYDNLGGGLGQTIGYVEGREAAQPFDKPTPIDAINAALVDEIFYRPVKS
jgi:microcompartment protein CcmK/EutM